jgi:hypothetical protein
VATAPRREGGEVATLEGGDTTKRKGGGGWWRLGGV